MQALLQILTIALAVFLFYRMFKGGGCCGGSHNVGHENHGGGCCSHDGHNARMQNDTNEQIETHKDPICGMYVSEKDAITRQINGQTVYFCSENCAREYERKNS